MSSAALSAGPKFHSPLKPKLSESNHLQRCHGSSRTAFMRKTKLPSLSLNPGKPQRCLSTTAKKYTYRHGPVAVRAQSHDEDILLPLAHQKYKAGNYSQALEHCNVVYEKNAQRTDNLLLLGAIYYQLHDFDMCITKNEEAIRIDPQFAECYGNMANAWKLRPNFCDAWSNLASTYMRKGR